MKIKLLIATADSAYAEHLANVLAEKHADAFEVSVCSAAAVPGTGAAARLYDAALLDPALLSGAALSAARLPLLLWDDTEALPAPAGEWKKIRKYQRVSAIAGHILAACAEASLGAGAGAAEKARITAVWSPAGGVGTTTAALAYATRKAADGRQVLYLDLEHFSSTPLYFAQTGPSITTLFAQLEGGQAGLLARGIRQRDSGSGLAYFCPPQNYDDLNILSAEDSLALVNACAAAADELVIDLPSLCDERVRRIFELADTVLLVTDASQTAQVKLRQFMTQHNVFERVRAKAALIANKGALLGESPLDTVISLPLVPAADAASVYKTLSANPFKI
jgi:Mrp family chromosome partitioning ATPase